MSADRNWEDLNPDERLARNLRSIRHELDTPFRGHDGGGECCRLAALDGESE